MKPVFINKITALGSGVMLWQDDHPYLFSMGIAIIFIMYILFYTPSFYFGEENYSSTDSIQFINIDTIKSAPRKTRKEVTSENSTTDENAEVERAVGSTDDSSAVDISFYPNIAPPRPISRLKKIYPADARDMNIESVVNVQILISSEGEVKDVRILGIRLSKALPADLRIKLGASFSRDAKKILFGVRFTPPIVEGKRVPVKMEMPLRFRLE